MKTQEISGRGKVRAEIHYLIEYDGIYFKYQVKKKKQSQVEKCSEFSEFLVADFHEDWRKI